MKERGMLFSKPMVLALLDGSKTQTRRVIKPAPDGEYGHFDPAHGFRFHGGPNLWCPYGQPGDRIWVREAIRLLPDQEPDDGLGRVLSFYDADGSLTVADAWPWRRKYLPPMHCPHGLSRIDLEITGVRVERLQDISEADAIAEGVQRDSDGWFDYQMPGTQCCQSAKDSYRTLWESLAGAGSWDANPWVWVIEFKRVEKAA